MYHNSPNSRHYLGLSQFHHAESLVRQSYRRLSHDMFLLRPVYDAGVYHPDTQGKGKGTERELSYFIEIFYMFESGF